MKGSGRLQRTLFQCLQHHRPPIATPRNLRPVIQRQHQRATSTRHSRYSPSNSLDPLDSLAQREREAAARAYYRRRTYYATAGMVICMAVIGVIATSVDLPSKPEQNEAPSQSIEALGGERNIVIVGSGEKTAEGDVEQVPTGTSSIPTFPKTILLNHDGSHLEDTEYQLLGLGIRTVSFLSIQVYVVGVYIATDDLAALQQAMVRRIDPIATTLIDDEKDKLRGLLLDPEKSIEIWGEVLRTNGIRSVLRVVPTRNTDFMHLRDGYVRGIIARSRGEECSDDSFGAAVGEFKKAFSARKTLAKGRTLLLIRDQAGRLDLRYDDNGDDRWITMGGLEDERLSRLLWLGYLGGKTVASEGARRSVVDGVMEIVERPVGTVATQVV